MSFVSLYILEILFAKSSSFVYPSINVIFSSAFRNRISRDCLHLPSLFLNVQDINAGSDNILKNFIIDSLLVLLLSILTTVPFI